MTERWFEWGDKETGWRKIDSARTRRARLMKWVDHRRTEHNQYLQAARKIRSLANVTSDPETRRKADADADYFFSLARETR
jgi:hypothetical protein